MPPFVVVVAHGPTGSPAAGARERRDAVHAHSPRRQRRAGGGRGRRRHPRPRRPGERGPAARAHVVCDAGRRRARPRRGPRGDVDAGPAGHVGPATGTTGLYRLDVTATVGRSAQGRQASSPSTPAPRPLVLAGAEGWRMLAPAYTTQSYDALLGPVSTQGFPRRRRPAGAPTVYTYAEGGSGAPRGYAPAAAQSALAAPGRGFFAYVYADGDPTTPGRQPGLPATVAQAGARYAGPFPAPFAVTRTDTGAPDADGWTLLGNPFTGGLDWDATGWSGPERTSRSPSRLGPQRSRRPAVPHVERGHRGQPRKQRDRSEPGVLGEGDGASPTLTAPASARVASGTLHGRPAAGGAVVLALRLEHGEVGGTAQATTAHIAFLDGAASGLDAHDAYELAPLVTALVLSTVPGDGAALDVDARPVPEAPVEIALGARVVGAGATALTLSSAGARRGAPGRVGGPAGGPRLRDLVDLREAASYTFEWAPAPTRAGAQRTAREAARASRGPTPPARRFSRPFPTCSWHGRPMRAASSSSSWTRRRGPRRSPRGRRQRSRSTPRARTRPPAHHRPVRPPCRGTRPPGRLRRARPRGRRARRRRRGSGPPRGDARRGPARPKRLRPPADDREQHRAGRRPHRRPLTERTRRRGPAPHAPDARTNHELARYGATGGVRLRRRAPRVGAAGADGGPISTTTPGCGTNVIRTRCRVSSVDDVRERARGRRGADGPARRGHPRPPRHRSPGRRRCR